MFEVKMLCYDYSKPEPYEDKIEAQFPTRELAENAMYHNIIDELNTLNGVDDEGNPPERRFTVLTEDEKYAAVVVCWDGEDYMPVTCYSIEETGKPAMTLERAMELLNSIIDHVAVAENTKTQIQELMNMGYAPDELVDYFNYSREDVDGVVGDEEDEE